MTCVFAVIDPSPEPQNMEGYAIAFAVIMIGAVLLSLYSSHVKRRDLEKRRQAQLAQEQEDLLRMVRQTPQPVVAPEPEPEAEEEVDNTEDEVEEDKEDDDPVELENETFTLFFAAGVTQDGRFVRVKFELSGVDIYSSACTRAQESEAYDTCEKVYEAELDRFFRPTVESFISARTYAQLMDSHELFEYEFLARFIALEDPECELQGYGCTLVTTEDEKPYFDYDHCVSLEWIYPDVEALRKKLVPQAPVAE